MRAIATVGLSLLVASRLAAGGIEARIVDSTLILPASLEANSPSFCTLGYCTIGPRLYLAPRSDGSFLIGWTDSSNSGHVSASDGVSLGVTHDFFATPVRGLVAHADGSFGVLLKDGVTLYLSKRAADGSEVWTTSLNSTKAEDAAITGDHRLAYGGGLYAAYWAVRGIELPFTGHDGDQQTLVDDGGVIQAGGWDMGCAHSLAQLVDYHPGDAEFVAFCSSDCYPEPPGLKMNVSTTIFAGESNCEGSVSVQLGQMAAAETGWKVAFNAVDTLSTEAFGVGLATAGGGQTPDVVWITATDGAQERDPVIARIDAELPERYLVGWRTASDGVFHLGIIGSDGVFLEGPAAMSGTGPGWGNRDDSFRTDGKGTVSWLMKAASSSVKLFRYVDDSIFIDGFESGDSSRWAATLP